VVLLNELVAASRDVAATTGRLAKTARLAAFLRQLDRNEIPIAVAFLSGTTRQGRIGVGGARLQALETEPAPHAQLTLSDVDAAFGAIAVASGRGSALKRHELLQQLLARATREEQQLIVRLLVGELRQGALEGVLLEAVASASSIPVQTIRRAAMLTGSLERVAQEALTGGGHALDQLSLEVLRPIDPMLADSAASAEDALRRLGRAAFEWKLDGARIQAHKSGDQIRIFTRNLRDVTHAVPEVVALLRELPASQLVLDGEVIALRPDGSPWPFQITMRRFGRRLDVDRLQQELPVTPFFFDCLVHGDRVLFDEPYSVRVAALDEALAQTAVVPRIVTASPIEAQAFLDDALARGHEGVMAKALDAPYAAGRRGQAWLKVKQARTLDLVVLAAEWGHGRRRGWLSNLHLGAREPAGGGFVMLGKTFKGLTDEMLAWQTERLLSLETHRDRYTVYVRPELVVEIAFDGVQQSPQYPGGLALRFARVKGYRHDRSAADADTFEAVRAAYRQLTGEEPPPFPPASQGEPLLNS
jgi:DNA ligase-1